MKFKVQGELYDFDDNSLSVDEARLIKQHANLGIRAWAQGVQEGDVDAIVAVIYLAKRRAGEAVKWADLNKLDLFTELEMIDEDDDAEDEAGEESDPTPPVKGAKRKTSGKTPKSE